MRRNFSLVHIALCLLWVGLIAVWAPPVHAQQTAAIEILGASPRDVAASDSDIFDETSSGLYVVGVGNKVYLEGSAAGGTGSETLRWSVTTAPNGSTAAPSSTSDALISLRPNVAGVYVVLLEVLDETQQIVASAEQLLIVSTYAGAGVFNTESEPSPIAPNCGTSFCHGENQANPRLRTLNDWLATNHAITLQAFMDGDRISHYDVSCLECHSQGFNQNPAVVNGGFDDIASTLGYDLEQIPQLVADAHNLDEDNFQDLPVEMQNMASVQCESCHGPGTSHPQRLGQIDKGIDGADLSYERCAVCHDSVSGFQQQFYQWGESAHPITADSAGGRVADRASCANCHTGKGFVEDQVDGVPIEIVDEMYPITCAACHDPHGSDNEHLLRVVGTHVLPSGDIYADPGNGGICVRCHNSRVSDALQTAEGSFRGAHHGPQADMMLGVNGVDFGLDIIGVSFHQLAIEDQCVACHMNESGLGGPGITAPPVVGEHSFSMRDNNGTPGIFDDDTIIAGNSCGTAACHVGLDTYDREAFGDYDGDGQIEGIQTEVRGLFDILRPNILATYPGVELDEATGAIDIDSDAFDTLAKEQKWALYNFNFVMEDGSFGIHNTAYAIQLLQRSYFGVTGRSIVKDYPEMTIRGEIQEPQNRVQQWILFQ